MTQRRNLARPDFPQHNYMELQKSHMNTGDNRHFAWDTTYNETMRPRTREVSRQKIDTVMLQKTHWNQGDCPSAMISEAHAAYPDYHQNVQRTQEITRDKMMKTTFSISDGVTTMQRQCQQVVASQVTPAANLKETMVATHFDLTSPAAPKWETTSKATFKRHNCPPSESAQMELNKGLGAKSTFDQLGAFGTTTSLYNDTYRNKGRAQTSMGRIPKAVIENDSINYVQNTTHKWQRTNFDLGDGKGRYSTAHAEATPRRMRSEPYDPRYASEQRIASQKSVINAGSNWAAVKSTTMQDAIRPHPECKPPPSAEKTAFISHQDHRNWNGDVTTTMKEAYGPKKAEKVDPVNNHLQASHASFGNDKISEMKTLYEDTFTKPPSTMERADMQAARNFHMGHHSKTKSGEDVRTAESVYAQTYVRFKDAKPSDMCDALKGGNNIVPNDPRFRVKKSAMKEDYVQYKGSAPPRPVDNSLQNSHLQLKGCAEPWTTSQQEYFQYETYKLPGRPF